MNPVYITPSYFSKIHLNIILPATSRSFSFLLAFPPKSYMHSSPHSCYMPCPSHPPRLDHSYYTRRSYVAIRYAVLSNLLLLHPSAAHIFPSAPCSQIPSVYVLLLMSETNFHTHTEPQAKCVLYVLIFTFLESGRENKGCSNCGDYEGYNFLRCDAV
jgi:hypothetical protein